MATHCCYRFYVVIQAYWAQQSPQVLHAVYRLYKLLYNNCYTQGKTQYLNYFINLQIMNKNRVIEQNKIYVKFDHHGHTQIIKSKNIQPGINYRRIHYTQYQLKKEKGQRLHFVDSMFQIQDQDFVNFDQSGRKIIVKRLLDLIKICLNQSQARLFPPQGYLPKRKISINPNLPSICQQFGLFPVQYFRSFFLTQDFSESGVYQMIVNNQGRFQNDIVDDEIPVYQDTFQPIWGIQLDQAWKIMMLKMWAKINKGYDKLISAPPFNFIQKFSNSNWKYYNLRFQARSFLQFYKNKINNGKIILKTKNSHQVLDSGLHPFSIGYQLVELTQNNKNSNQFVISGQKSENGQLKYRQHQNQSKSYRKTSKQVNRYILTIKSTVQNKWTGSLSIVDKQMSSIYQPRKLMISLDRDLIMNDQNFVNLFSVAYVTSKRELTQKQYTSDYVLLNFPENNKTSIYFKFNLQKDSWFDFCVKQFDQNRLIPSANSRIHVQNFNKHQGINDSLRYLKCKYLLVKKNQMPSTDGQYNQLTYQCVDIQYLKGYNRGDARFLQLKKGSYIIKIKPQKVNKQSYFVLNYACSQKLKVRQFFPDKKQKSQILRHSMTSLISSVSSYHLEETKQYEQIAFGNLFQQIGYGFIGVKAKKTSKYRIMMQFNPQKIRNSGYKIKNQFKNITEYFSIIVNPGDCTSVVLKKIPASKYIWPPQGVQIYKQM